MGRLGGTPHGIATLRDVLYDDFAALREARVQEDARLVALADGLSPAQLEETVSWTPTSGKGSGTTRRDHMLLTLYNHQTHHRGQVTAMFTQAGATYPDLDVPFYLREQGLL